MKKLISIFILIVLFSQNVFADTSSCDWSTIRKNSDGTYTYSEQLNLCVGQLVEDSKVKDTQIQYYQKAIQLKDLALTQDDQRVLLWSNTSDKLENDLQKVDSEQKHNDLLWLGMGVLGTVLTGFMTARLIGR